MSFMIMVTPTYNVSSRSLVEPPNPRKKKPLTDIEIALKREETARKRRNLSEKKLEDEKVNFFLSDVPGPLTQQIIVGRNN